MTYIHYYGKHRIFIVLEALCTLPIQPSVYFSLYFNIQDTNDSIKWILYYLLELYIVLYVFPWLHDNIQDNL